MAAVTRTVCRKFVNYTVIFVTVPTMVAHTVAGYRFVTGISMVRLLAGSLHGGLLPVTWICPLGTHGLVYRVRPIMEGDRHKDSKMTWRQRRKVLIRI
jgi:hypothetical protein